MGLYLLGVLYAILFDPQVLSVHSLAVQVLKSQMLSPNVLNLEHKNLSVESLSTVLLLVLIDHDAHYYTHYHP